MTTEELFWSVVVGGAIGAVCGVIGGALVGTILGLLWYAV